MGQQQQSQAGVGGGAGLRKSSCSLKYKNNSKFNVLRGRRQLCKNRRCNILLCHFASRRSAAHRIENHDARRHVLQQHIGRKRSHGNDSKLTKKARGEGEEQILQYVRTPCISEWMDREGGGRWTGREEEDGQGGRRKMDSEGGGRGLGKNPFERGGTGEAQQEKRLRRGRQTCAAI